MEILSDVVMSELANQATYYWDHYCNVKVHVSVTLRGNIQQDGDVLNQHFCLLSTSCPHVPAFPHHSPDQSEASGT